MTQPDEIAALRRVVEAMTMAEHALHNSVVLWGARATDMPQLAWLQQVGEAREALANAARRIDGLPAASPPVVDKGETVEVRVAVAPYQTHVGKWMMACFGQAITQDGQERCHRFLEEALELVQSCGGTQEDAHRLVNYVFGRPIGEPAQEAGGVMVTLAALANVFGIDVDDAAATELARCWQKIDRIREKQKGKPIRSPLPGPTIPTVEEPK
jgi:hypothetical protein